MIDGVDGYSSGYAMLACLCFAIAFHTAWTPGMVCLTMIAGGALLPFFLHNVFGYRSRMFIGDGGTLMLGMLLTALAFCALSSKVGLADKSHLHHLFIDLGFSHLGAAMFIIQLNLIVLLGWWLAWYLGASLDVQLYIVVAMALAVTSGVYGVMRWQQNGGPVDEEGYPQGTKLWHLLCCVGNWTHKEDKRGWRIMRYLMDYPLLGRYFRFNK